MDTLAELVNYCEEPEPVGALLLTGEWGCGKTFLVEHSLKDTLRQKFLFVRISLFGINSVESFHTAVKCQWIISCHKIFGEVEKRKGVFNKGKNILSDISLSLPGPFGNISKAILSINIADFINIHPIIGKENKKTIILVFDDMERSKLSKTELLGCINEYCENQNFHVIIIANEERIAGKGAENGNQEELSYDEIKEKVIARTVHYKPDLPVIINSIVDKRDWGYDDYKQYLIERKSLILYIFQTDKNDKNINIDKKPSNLRILKSALQDFGRVYQRFKNSKIRKIDRYFISFIVYSLVIKSGNVPNKTENIFDFERNISKNYPGYDYRFMLDSCRIWIRNGDWNEDHFSEDLQAVVENDKEDDPEYMIRNFSVVLIEDDDLPELFAGLLKDCYSGNLTLKRYINFIRNSAILRENESPLYSEINWNKVHDGIQKRFAMDVESNEEESLYTHFYHDSEDRKRYKDDELVLYNMIKDFCQNNQVLFDNTEKQFIAEIKQNGFSSAIRLNIFYDRFTLDMEQAVYFSFQNSSQDEKISYDSYFRHLWNYIDIKTEKRKKEAIANLKKLSDDLQKFHSELVTQKKIFAAKHTKTFHDSIEELLLEMQQVNLRLQK